MFEFKKQRTDGGTLNFDKSFLLFNVKKKIYANSYFKRRESLKLKTERTEILIYGIANTKIKQK